MVGHRHRPGTIRVIDRVLDHPIGWHWAVGRAHPLLANAKSYCEIRQANHSRLVQSAEAHPMAEAINLILLYFIFSIKITLGHCAGPRIVFGVWASWCLMQGFCVSICVLYLTAVSSCLVISNVLVLLM